MITVLIGGSILLIVGSGIALVFGFSGTDDTLLWTSIGASAGAALFLALAYFQSKRQTRPRVADAPESARADEAPVVQEVGADDESAPSRVPSAAADEAPAADEEERAVPEEVGAASSATAELPVPDVEPPAEEPAAATPTARATRKTAARPTAKKTTRKTSAKPATKSGRAPAKEAPAAATSKTAGQVVAIPTTKKFHKPDCRYASAAGGERLTKTTARRRGYSACGVCKP